MYPLLFMIIMEGPGREITPTNLEGDIKGLKLHEEG